MSGKQQEGGGKGEGGRGKGEGEVRTLYAGGSWPNAASCVRRRVNPVPARRVLRLVNDTGYPDGRARPEGRLLALRCLGIPQVTTRAPMSRRRALWYRLAACWARIRPGTTSELASLVLRMSDEIDTRERMLDAALGVAGRGHDRADFDQAAEDAGCDAGAAGWKSGE